VASYPLELVQIDMYHLSKYGTYNKNYKFIFAMVDVFSRIAYALPMKTKSIDDTTNTSQMIIKKSGIQPTIIMSDNDLFFLGDKFRVSTFTNTDHNTTQHAIRRMNISPLSQL
jgi:transposase